MTHHQKPELQISHSRKVKPENSVSLPWMEPAATVVVASKLNDDDTSELLRISLWDQRKESILNCIKE